MKLRASAGKSVVSRSGTAIEIQYRQLSTTNTELCQLTMSELYS
jgi:hypothetical protein